MLKVSTLFEKSYLISPNNTSVSHNFACLVNDSEINTRKIFSLNLIAEFRNIRNCNEILS